MKFIEKIIKFINHLPNLGCCPNCGINWFYVKKSNIEAIWYIEDSGMMICKKCFDNPKKLNFDRINYSLIQGGWPQNKVELINIKLKKLIPIKEIRKQKLQKLLKNV